jgi:hypothetical protein
VGQVIYATQVVGEYNDIMQLVFPDNPAKWPDLSNYYYIDINIDGRAWARKAAP